MIAPSDRDTLACIAHMPNGPYVTEQQIEAMRKLERFKEKHGKGMTASELAKHFGVLRQGMAQMLERMRKKDFVTRTVDTSAPRKREDGGNAGVALAYRYMVTAKGRTAPEIRAELDKLAESEGFSSRQALIDAAETGDLSGTILESQTMMLLHLLGKEPRD
jgi:predicted ArsR family transcriptional regulator